MKIFLDTADIEAIKKAGSTGLIDGITTNPSKLAQAGGKFSEVVKEICAIVPGPVSVEAVGDTADRLIEMAQQNAALATNVVVKIPMTVEGLKAVPVLEKEKNIRVNVTMVFSSTQAYLAMKAGASYVSIVLSRLDACANESDILVADAVTVKQNYGFNSEIIAGSLKTQNHILSCLRAGVDIATIPDSLFFQMFAHPLTDSGLAQFEKDWKKVPK